MTTTAVVLVLCSAIMHALKNFFTKRAVDKQVFVWCYKNFGLIYFLPVFGWIVIREPVEWSSVLLFTALSGIIHFLYIIFLTRSLEHGDLSLVYPIMRSAPALVLVVAIVFLNEQVTPAGVGGIMLVASGVYLINLRRISWDALFNPVAQLFARPDTRYAFLTMLMVAAYSIIDKLAVQQNHPLVYAFMISLASYLLLTIYLAGRRSREQVIAEWRLNRTAILLCGAFAFFGYLLILMVLVTEPVSYVTGLRQLSIVFAVLLGGHLLAEDNRAVRLTASAIIFAGAFLISTAR